MNTVIPILDGAECAHKRETDEHEEAAGLTRGNIVFLHWLAIFDFIQSTIRLESGVAPV